MCRFRAVATALAAMISLLWLVAACSTRVDEAETAPDFAADLAAGPSVALAPVTVAPAVGGVLAGADQADADDALYAAFLAAAPGLEVWQEPTVRSLVGDEELNALSDQYSRFGRLRPDQVRPLAAPLAGCRFLALARLLEEEVRTHAQNQTASDPEARSEGLAEHGRPWTSIVSVEREVRVGLEIFELASGESVWRSEATSRHKQLYEYAEGMGDDPAQYIHQRIERANGPDHLSRGGEALQLPDLVDLLRRAFTGLVDRLPVPGS